MVSVSKITAPKLCNVMEGTIEGRVGRVGGRREKNRRSGEFIRVSERSPLR